MTDTFNAFAAIGDALVEGAKEMAVDVATELQDSVRAHMLDKGLYKTGFMHDSVYKKTAEGSDYSSTGDKALPEIGDQVDDTTGYVAVGAVYGAIQNYGGRGIPAHPYWELSLDEVRNNMDQHMLKLEDKTRRVGR